MSYKFTSIASSLVLLTCLSISPAYAGSAENAVDTHGNPAKDTNPTPDALPLTPIKNRTIPSPITSTNKITLNFQNIETRKLLQILAQFSHSNFVISDEVEGSMSIHLKDVPWTQALRVILKSQGLSRQQIGNIVMIGPIDQMAAREIKELEVSQKIEQLEPQATSLVHLNYAKAKSIVEMIRKENISLLSSRGAISYDERTNTVWLKDNVARINEVKRLIRRLDHPVKQVEIQARIVTIDRPYEKEFGARFGLSITEHVSGTLPGANQLAQGTAPANVTPISDRLNFNIPAQTLFTNPGSIAMAVTNFGSFFIDTELSALEREGHSELIGNPRVITSDQHEAHIQEGQEIPYQASTSSGATNIEFKDATLSLTVTPHVTPDNRVILTMKITRNKVSSRTVNIDGLQVVPIDTEEEESQVLLNNKQTVVMGGIYTEDKQDTIIKVPWLGDIPIIGLLFRHKQVVNSKKELLVFLTPRIINHPNQLGSGIRPILSAKDEDREPKKKPQPKKKPAKKQQPQQTTEVYK